MFLLAGVSYRVCSSSQFTVFAPLPFSKAARSVNVSVGFIKLVLANAVVQH